MFRKHVASSDSVCCQIQSPPFSSTMSNIMRVHAVICAMKVCVAIGMMLSSFQLSAHTVSTALVLRCQHV